MDDGECGIISHLPFNHLFLVFRKRPIPTEAGIEECLNAGVKPLILPELYQ
jgi:hypothetical protein